MADGFHQPKSLDGDKPIYDYSVGGLGTPPTWLAPRSKEASATAFTSYTPTWASTGTAVAIGNAVVVSGYKQVGKIVTYYGAVTFGTTSTYGTGNYTFTLPVTAAANNYNSQVNCVGIARLFDNSASALGIAHVRLNSNAAIDFIYGATYLGTATAVGQTTPWTWATSDVIAWTVVYEAA